MIESEGRGEREGEEKKDDEVLMDGGKLTETEILSFLCPSRTIHCRRRRRRPDGDTNESTSLAESSIVREEKRASRALNSTGIGLMPHDPSVHFLLDRVFKCSIARLGSKEEERRESE